MHHHRGRFQRPKDFGKVGGLDLGVSGMIKDRLHVGVIFGHLFGQMGVIIVIECNVITALILQL